VDRYKVIVRFIQVLCVSDLTKRVISLTKIAGHNTDNDIQGFTQLSFKVSRVAYPFWDGPREEYSTEALSYYSKIHNYVKCIYAYGKREPGCDHTPGAYTNIGASPDFV
jgi:hypothetical protein